MKYIYTEIHSRVHSSSKSKRRNEIYALDCADWSVIIYVLTQHQVGGVVAPFLGRARGKYSLYVRDGSKQEMGRWEELW